jgi:hypothetical protein
MKPEIDQIIGEMFPEYRLLADEEAKDDFWSDLNEHQTYAVNREYLLRTENPEYDYLVCWEPGRMNDEESIFDYPTFYEFDVRWWEFQRDATWETIEDMKKWMEGGSKHHTPETVAKAINDHNERYKEYEMYCTGDWFRLMEGETFIYAQMISAKWYVFYHLENLIDDMLDSHIPWEFKGDREDWLKAINADTPEETYEAGGRERELEGMKKKIRDYTNTTLLEMIETNLKKYPYSGKTFRYDRGYVETETEKFDPFTDFIFYDVESLKNVRTKHFLEDFKANQGNSTDLDEIIVDLKEMVAGDFERMYNENRSRYLQK